MPIVDHISGRGQSTSAEASLQQAMYAIQTQQPHEAVRLARAVLDKNPDYPKALQLYGHALLLQGRAEEAIAPLEKAFRSLRDPAIESQLAIALVKAGRTDDAINVFARAAKRKAPVPAVIYEYGCLLFSLGRMDEAIDVLKAGIEKAPLMPELPALLGWVHHSQNDPVNAKVAFARALDIAPNQINALHGMGCVLMGAGEFAKASEYFQQVLQSMPSDPEARLYLGACLLELGRTDAAMMYLQQVASEANYYGRVLTILSSSSRGRFWLRPAAASDFLKGDRS